MNKTFGENYDALMRSKSAVMSFIYDSCFQL